MRVRLIRGLLRFARNDEGYGALALLIGGCHVAHFVRSSMTAGCRA